MRRAQWGPRTRAVERLTVSLESHRRSPERRDKFTYRARMASTRTCHQSGCQRIRGTSWCRIFRSWNGCRACMMNQKMKRWMRVLTGRREPYLSLQILIPGEKREIYKRITRLFGQVGLKSPITFKSQEPLVKSLRSSMVGLRSLNSRVWPRRIKFTRTGPKLRLWETTVRKKHSLLSMKSSWAVLAKINQASPLPLLNMSILLRGLKLMSQHPHLRPPRMSKRRKKVS